MTASPDHAPPPNLRHRQKPMEKIQLPASELAALVPAEARLRSGAEEGVVELEARTALAHIVPHISLSDLAAARPDIFSGGDQIIRLPASMLVSAYRIEEETCDESEKFSLALDTRDQPELPSPVRNLEQATQLPTPEPENDSPALELPVVETPPFEPSASEPAQTAAPEPSLPDQPHRLIELIQSLPTFHRFSPAESREPLLLETEPCGDTADLPDQNALQALFLTEEKLTVRRVVELCGELPGIRSCVLTHGEMVVSAHNVPEGLDLVSMSSTASKMLDAMRESAAQLGIGGVPALTLHTDSGPLSVVVQGPLAMLVVHADRGFIPGVREKLTAALAEMSRAPLALPRPSTPQE